MESRTDRIVCKQRLAATLPQGGDRTERPHDNPSGLATSSAPPTFTHFPHPTKRKGAFPFFVAKLVVSSVCLFGPAATVALHKMDAELPQMLVVLFQADEADTHEGPMVGWAVGKQLAG